MHVTVFKRRDSKCYWIWYYRNGKRIKESTKATNKKTAQLIADQKEEEPLRALGIGNPDRLLLSSLIREVIADYRVNKNQPRNNGCVSQPPRHYLPQCPETGMLTEPKLPNPRHH